LRHRHRAPKPPNLIGDDDSSSSDLTDDIGKHVAGDDVLESSELPAAARIQQEPGVTATAVDFTAGTGAGGDDDVDEAAAPQRVATLQESGEILHELRAKDTIFYENVTIPESEHDNLVPTGEGERGPAKGSVPVHGHRGHGHPAGGRGRSKSGRDDDETGSMQEKRENEEDDEVRRPRRHHGHL
jgi:hypothetical protein